MQLFHLRHVWTVLVFMKIVYMTRILIKSKLLGEGSMDLRFVWSPVVEYITCFADVIFRGLLGAYSLCIMKYFYHETHATTRIIDLHSLISKIYPFRRLL